MTLGLAAIDHLLLCQDPVGEATKLGWITESPIKPHYSYKGFLFDACAHRLQKLELPRSPSPLRRRARGGRADDVISGIDLPLFRGFDSSVISTSAEEDNKGRL